MKCPNCNETLLITERHNIEIDYCPACRGVWLDKGELDKMLDFAERKHSAAAVRIEGNIPGSNDHTYPYQQQKYKHHKKKSFLGDLFDFD